MDKFLTAKNIFIVLGVVVLVELVWALFSLTRPIPPPPITQPKTLTQPGTSITLSADKSQLKVGEKVTVAINISSSRRTDGTDLIIVYDPKLVTVQTVANKAPVLVGTLYNDYPQNILETDSGRITVSGITNQTTGLVPNGLFGSITLMAKAKGVAKISLDFTPGKTVDSNIIETGTGADVLEKVNNLEVNILP